MDRTMPPQSANGMGGKETSKRAPAASHVTLLQSTHPSLAHCESGAMNAPSAMDDHRQAYVYAFSLIAAAVLTIYVFALSS